MADLGRLEQSPDCHRATDYEPSSEKVQSNRRVTSLFGSSNEDEPPSPIKSPNPSSALIYVRDGDDGGSRRSKSYWGTPVSVSTIQGSTDSKVSTLAPERKPWLLPERLLNCLSGETTPHNKYPFLVQSSYMGLILARRTFALRRIFTSMLSSSIDGTMAKINETKSR